MRLLVLAASNFLTFENLSIDLDPELTVIVGPNGAGKSSLVRILDLALTALSTAAAGTPMAWSRLAVYDNAGRHGASEAGFQVGVTFALSDPWEQEVMSRWLVAAISSQVVLHNSGQPLQREEIDAQATAELLAEDLSGFMTARLVVAHTGGVMPSWAIGVEFDIRGQTYTYGLHGPGVGSSLWRGQLADGQAGGGRALRDQFAEDGDLSRLVFSLDRLLPESGPVTLEVASSGGFLPSGLEFVRVAGANPSTGRNFTLADVLRSILNRAVQVVRGERLPARVLYSVADLNRRADPDNPGEVPLQLYNRRNGDIVDRGRFQSCVDVFGQVTRAVLDLRTKQTATPGPSGGLVGDQDEVLIEPVIIEDGFETPITLAGSGRWESLVLCAALTNGQGSVLVLDEPAANLSPTLQRRVFDAVRSAQSQLILVTHSPYMVPASELGRVIRIAKGPDRAAVAHPFRPANAVPAVMARRQQILEGSTDARGLLFSEGVILVEGDTEIGCLPNWFNASETAKTRGTLDALNIVVHPVGADTAFRTYVDLLQAFALPWAIICDGPVLDPNRAAANLAHQLSVAAVSGLERGQPEDDAFPGWRSYWEAHGVFTLADRFGTTDKTGELEAYLANLDAEGWKEATTAFPRSKVRAARQFAGSVPCPAAVNQLYSQLLDRFRA